MKRQSGAALLALMLVLALGASWMFLDRMSRVSGEFAAAERAHNARVLQRAKQTLIGHVARQAGMDTEEDPGRLPCPEAFGSIGGPNEGINPGTCAAPTLGRLPWRSLGGERFLDAHGEPLWYVVSPGWHLQGAGGSLVINSDTAGQLRVDGVNNDAVALIIAPGRAMNVAAAAGCAARSQVRATPSPAINPLDYLECYNAAAGTYMTTGPTTSFNDQVVRITAAELMPGIEGAIAQRIERSIAPVLKTVYASNTWGANVSAATPVYPFAAPFPDLITLPQPQNPTISKYQGVAGQTAGLLPFNQTQGCDSGTDPRCTNPPIGPSAFLVFSKNGNDTFQTLIPPLPLGWIRTQSSCAWTGNTYACTGEYQLASIRVTHTLRVTNVAMGLRTFDNTKISCTAVDDAGGGIPLQNIGCASTSVALQADGSALVTVTTNWTPDIVTSGWGTYANYTISFDREVFGDHALLDPTNAATGWFVRNQWYRLVHYVAARGHTAAVLPVKPPACPTAMPAYAFDSSCLTVANVMPADSQRAILLLAGRSINGSARPSAVLGDYLEFGNAAAAYESWPPSLAMDAASRKPMNDRVVVIDANP